MLQTFPARCIAWSAENGGFFTDNVTIRQCSQRKLVQAVVSSNDVVTVVIEIDVVGSSLPHRRPFSHAHRKSHTLLARALRQKFHRNGG